MKCRKMPLVVFIMFVVRVSSAQPSEARQTPLLVAETGRAVPASRGGVAQSFQISSVILNETRRILVVLPASYSQSAPERRYPVTVVVDGEYLVAPVAAVSDELSRNGQIPESVIVGIENVGGADWLVSNKKRVYDLTPPGLSVSGSGLNEGGDRFLDFIEQELLPALDRQFRTAAPRAFVGVSSGGILATYVAATRPTYRAVVSLDAPVRLGDNWLAKKLTERAAAREAYNTLVAGYGAQADDAELLTRIAEVERRPAPAETVEGLLATPFPTPEEARAFIGEWLGDAWIDHEKPRTDGITLRIKVVNGQVVGETVHHDATDGGLAMRWEYLKITPKGMTWGFMNGMRPRGVILFEGALEGDTLAGKSRFGGVDFRLPDGSPPPSPSFSFKRVRK